MAEQDSDIPTWLREAASSFEEVVGSDAPVATRRSRESGHLQSLVDRAADRLALLRLQNLRESLADVEDVLDSLKRELDARRREGRNTRLTEGLIREAEAERARLLGQIAGATDLPGIYSGRRHAYDSYERPPVLDERAVITQHFAQFYQPRHEDSWEATYAPPPSRRLYREESLEDDRPDYYSRRSEAPEERPEAPDFQLSPGSRTVRDPARPREKPSWMSVRVERKTRTPEPTSEFRLGSAEAPPRAARPAAERKPLSLEREKRAPESPRARPAAPERPSWLGGGPRGARPEERRRRDEEVTAEDLPAVLLDDDSLLDDDLELGDELGLDLGDLEAGDELLLEPGDADLELGDLDLDADGLELDDLDLGDLDDLGELGELGEEDELDLEGDLLLEDDEAELVDDELAEPFTPDLEEEIGEDLDLLGAAELDEADLDLDSGELEAVAGLDEVELESADAELPEVDVDVEDLELGTELADDEVDLDLGDLDELGDLEGLDDLDLDLTDLEDLDLGDLDLDEADLDMSEIDIDTPDEELGNLELEGVAEDGVELIEPLTSQGDLVEIELADPALSATEDALEVGPPASDTVLETIFDDAPETLQPELVADALEFDDLTEAVTTPDMVTDEELPAPLEFPPAAELEPVPAEVEEVLPVGPDPHAADEMFDAVEELAVESPTELFEDAAALQAEPTEVLEPAPELVELPEAVTFDEVSADELFPTGQAETVEFYTETVGDDGAATQPVAVVVEAEPAAEEAVPLEPAAVEEATGGPEASELSGVELTAATETATDFATTEPVTAPGTAEPELAFEPTGFDEPFELAEVEVAPAELQPTESETDAALLEAPAEESAPQQLPADVVTEAETPAVTPDVETETETETETNIDAADTAAENEPVVVTPEPAAEEALSTPTPVEASGAELAAIEDVELVETGATEELVLEGPAAVEPLEQAPTVETVADTTETVSEAASAVETPERQEPLFEEPAETTPVSTEPAAETPAAPGNEPAAAASAEPVGEEAVEPTVGTAPGVEEPAASVEPLAQVLDEPGAEELVLEAPAAVEPVDEVGELEAPVAEPSTTEPVALETHDSVSSDDAPFDLFDEPDPTVPAVEEPVALEAPAAVEEPVATEEAVTAGATEADTAASAEPADVDLFEGPTAAPAEEAAPAVAAELLEPATEADTLPDLFEAVEPVTTDVSPAATEPEDLFAQAGDAPLDLFEAADPVTEAAAPVETAPVAAAPEAAPVATPLEDALPELDLDGLDLSASNDFFEGASGPGETSFLEDDLFAFNELPPLEAEPVASAGPADPQSAELTGSSELLDGAADFFGEGMEGDSSWLDEPLAEEDEAPEWLKSPDEELPAAPGGEVLEDSIEAAASAELLESPAPSAVETAAPPTPAAPTEPGGASAQERRRLVRLSCAYDTTAYFEGRPIPVKLVDISLGGGKLTGPAGFERGNLIQVSNPLPEAKNSDPVTSRVVWMRPNKEQAQRFDIGLQFEESPEVLGRSWVITVLNKIGMQSKVFNQRKYTRAVANLPIDVELITKEKVSGVALDLGLGGALIGVNRPMTPTTKVTLLMGPLGNHDRLELRCELISSRPDEEGGHGWIHSVKFNEISTTQTKLLGRYVVDLLKTGGSV